MWAWPAARLPGCLAAWLSGCLAAAWLPGCLAAAWLPGCLGVGAGVGDYDDDDDDDDNVFVCVVLAFFISCVCVDDVFCLFQLVFPHICASLGFCSYLQGRAI